MKMQQLLLTLVGATVSIILAVVLIWYSKNSITKTVSRRHILHMLKSESKNSMELTETVKGRKNNVISPKMVPVMLVKLQEEGLIQRTDNNKYVITTEGLESLKSLDSMSKEFQKLGKIVQKTSMISKFMITEAIDRLSMIAGMDDATYGYMTQGMDVPAYGTD